MEIIDIWNPVLRGKLDVFFYQNNFQKKLHLSTIVQCRNCFGTLTVWTCDEMLVSVNYFDIETLNSQLILSWFRPERSETVLCVLWRIFPTKNTVSSFHASESWEYQVAFTIKVPLFWNSSSSTFIDLSFSLMVSAISVVLVDD